MNSMVWMIKSFCLHSAYLASLVILVSSATEPADSTALNAFYHAIQDPFGRLSNWQGNDPCNDQWSGVVCSDPLDGITTVIELRLLNYNLSGYLAPELGDLTNLQILDLMWNQITGTIPSELGKLANLRLLLLNGNQLTGTIPDELGNLGQMERFQIDSNNISGVVPSSFKNLSNVEHLHMNNNSLMGSIPPELGSLPSLLHLLLDNNKLSGILPKELTNVGTLQIIQLDNNQFTNATIPDEYGRITNLTKLSLRNCNLEGPIPNLNGLINLQFLDLSHNGLSGEMPSFLSDNVTAIDLSYNTLNGYIPNIYGNLPNLQYLVLSNNNLTGPIPQGLGTGTLFSSNTWSGNMMMDFQNNSLTSVSKNLTSAASQRVQILLYGNNAICNNISALVDLCIDSHDEFFPENENDDIVAKCEPSPCVPGEEADPSVMLKENICWCAMPISIGYRLKSPGFVFFKGYVTAYEHWIADAIRVSQDQVYLESFIKMPGPRFATILKVFPSYEGESRVFNETEVMRIYEIFSAWKLPRNDLFGPQELLFFNYSLVPINVESQKSLSWGAIAGILVACISLTAIVVALVIFRVVFYKGYSIIAGHRSSISRKDTSGFGRMKIAGTRAFTYKELAAATKSFSEKMQVGAGGYGNVYCGNMSDGQVVAIKRAKKGSHQGEDEFYTEIQLLSRIHHRNLVSLVGYCDDEGEQMLVYEFMVNGSLRDLLARSNSNHIVNFSRRLQIALGAARGILYLHTEADPPIFHRDIKASNILLDEKLIAKVSDFGLSRLAPNPESENSALSDISTVVKGTPGYLDPEYFRTHVLTNKSDVYSFGVVLLELITGMEPIAFGKNIVREIKFAYENGMMLSVVDSRMGAYSADALEPLVRLALSCCKQNPEDRPTMAGVVHELEGIWKMAPCSDLSISSASVELEDMKLKSTAATSVQDSQGSLHAAESSINSIVDLQPR